MAKVSAEGPADKWPGLQNPPRAGVTSAPDYPMFGRRWWRVCASHPCPICRGDSWCLVRPDETICKRDDSGQIVKFKDGEEAHWHPHTPESALQGFYREGTGQDWSWGKDPLQDEAWLYRSAVKDEAPPSNLAPLELRDRVYRALLDSLSLSAADGDKLIRRGLSEDSVRRNLYRTFPRGGRAEIAQEVMERCGLVSLAGVPGFYRKASGRGEPRWTMAGMSGILIPYKNEKDLIGFLQIRTEDAANRYYAFSSAQGKDERIDGAGARVAAHVAIPKGADRRLGRIWITEGALKADVACEYLGEIVIGVPGVGMWMRAFEAAKELLVDEFGREVVVAYDADKREPKKAGVRKAEAKLVAQLAHFDHHVKIAEWDTGEDFQPKGIDDLLHAGMEPRLLEFDTYFASLPPETKRDGKSASPKLRTCPAPEWLGVEQDWRSVTYAQFHVAGHLLAAMDAAARRKRFLHVRSDPTGTGKTSALVMALRYRLGTGWPAVKTRGKQRPLRVAVLVDSSREEEGEETISKGAKLAKDIGDEAVFLEGRNEANCARMDEVRLVAHRNHDVMATLCIDCQKRFNPRDPKLPSFIDLKGPWNAVCPYLRARTAAEEKSIHVMHKASLLGPSKRSADYDLIVCDEDLSGGLLQSVVYREEDIKEWIGRMIEEYASLRQRMNRESVKVRLKQHRRTVALRETVEIAKTYLNLGKHLSLARLIHETMTAPMPQAGKSGTVPLLTRLLELARTRGVNLQRLISSCGKGAYREIEGKHYFEHEKPKVAGSGPASVPFRAWRATLDALCEEIKHGSGDSRIWLHGGQVPTVEVKIPRSELVTTLRQRAVVNLDATPNAALLKDALASEQVAVPVRENVYLVQLTDAIFGKKASLKRLPLRIVAILKHALKGWREHGIGILTHKATLTKLGWLDDKDQPVKGALRDLAGGPIRGSSSVVLGYWGRDERATNRFENCSLLLVSGLHIPPLDEVERVVQAWRLALGKPRPDPSPAEQVYRPYGYMDDAGAGVAYLCPRHADPDVDAELVRLWSANVRQAIGRLRGTRSAWPKLVILDSAMPAEGVALHGLASLQDVASRIQPEPLRAQTEVNKREAQARLKRNADLVRPHYQELLKLKGEPFNAADLARHCATRGVKLTDHDWNVVTIALHRE